DDLLDTSRIVSGKLTIERRAVNLVEIVLTALDATRPGAAAKEIDLRFTHDDTSAARRAGGLGIGLALVRHIALLHGGQVRADSAGNGRGSTFTVELPAAPANLARPIPVPDRASAQE